MPPLSLRILIPTGEVVNTQTDHLKATGLLGEFGILSGHLPYLSALRVGPATFQDEKQTRYFALGEGFAEVYNDNVTLFVETAEEATKISVPRAQEALNRAEAELKRFTGSTSDAEFIRLTQARERALTRLLVAKYAVEYNLPA